MSSDKSKEELSFENITSKLNYDLKQNIIISGPPPTLKYSLFSKIATDLWHYKLRCFDIRLIEYIENNNKYTKILKYVVIYEKEITDSVCKMKIPRQCIIDLNQIVHFVGLEVRYYLSFYLCLYDDKILANFKVFFDNICWTQQGTINYLKTTMQIIDKSDLSIKDKYELACKICAEETIRDLFNKLADDDIKEFENDANPLSMPSFWTSCIKNDQIPTLIGEVSTFVALFESFDNRNNAITVQYYWEKFDNEIKKENLMNITEYVNANVSSNSVLYFVKQMNQLQLKKLSSTIRCRLLHKLHTISIWRNVFSTSNYIKKLISTKDFYHNFVVLIFCWFENLLEVEEFLTVWKEFAVKFKPAIERNIFDLYVRNFAFGSYFSKRQFIVAIFLLNMTTSENKRKLIFSLNTKNYCELMILGGGLENVEFFLSKILETDEIINFRKFLFEVSGSFLCRCLINCNKYEALDEFLNKFLAKESISSFKMELIYVRYVCPYFHDFDEVICEEIDLMSAMDKYLSWCFDGDTKEVAICKSLVFDIDSNSYLELKNFLFKGIKDLINQRRYKYVIKYWQWFYYATEKNLSTWGKKLGRVEKIIRLSTGEPCISTFLNNSEFKPLLGTLMDSFLTQEEKEKMAYDIRNNNESAILDD